MNDFMNSSTLCKYRKHNKCDEDKSNDEYNKDNTPIIS